MRTHEIDSHTMAWNAQVWISFLVSSAMTLGAVVLMPGDVWMKGYLLMGMLFTMGSCFSLAKTVRDNQETARLRNRLQAAKTDKVLRDFELHDAA